MFEFPVFNRFTLQPAQPFQSSFVRNRSALQVFSHRINQPHSWAVAESPAKPETVLSMPQANGLIGGLGKGEFRFRASPSLIRQIGCLQPDGIVETGQEAVWVLDLIDGRALVCNQPLAIYEKFILFCFTTEDGMIFQNRSEEHTSELQSRLHLVCRLLLEKKKKPY